MFNKQQRRASHVALGFLSAGLMIGLASPQAWALETAAAQIVGDKPASLLFVEDGVGGDLFGTSIDLSNNVVVVGAPESFDQEGSAYVSTWSGAAWSKPVELPLATEEGESTGFSVAIDGDFIVVGSRGSSEPDQGQAELRQQVGSATFLRRVNGVWTPQGRAYSSQLTEGGSFGFSVDLMGDLAIIGEPGANAPAENKRQVGAVYIASRDAQDNWQQLQRLVAPGLKQNGDAFGTQVKLTRVGSRVHAFVAALGRDDRGEQSGAVYVFERARAGGTFRHIQTLLASDGAAEDRFGHSLAVQGERLVVGAPTADVGSATDAGAAYVFERGSQGWTQRAILTPSSPLAGGLFGASVAVDATRVAVASNRVLRPGEAPAPAKVALFERQASGPSFAELESYEFSEQAGGLLASLELQGKSLFVGASQGLGDGTQLSGRVQVVDTSPKPAPLGGPLALVGLGLGMLALRRRSA